MNDIINISSSCYEKREGDIISLLESDDPDYTPGDDERFFRLYIGENVILEDEYSQIKSDILKDTITKYNREFQDLNTFDCAPQIILRFLEKNKYRLWIETYHRPNFDFIQDIIITKDIVCEYIKNFHNRFYDVNLCRIPELLV